MATKTVTPEFVKSWSEEYESFGVKIDGEWINCYDDTLIPLFKKGQPVTIETAKTKSGKEKIVGASKSDKPMAATSGACEADSTRSSIELQTIVKALAPQYGTDVELLVKAVNAVHVGCFCGATDKVEMAKKALDAEDESFDF